MNKREIPQAEDLERIVLGAMILEPDSYFTVSNILATGCFNKPEHKYIFKVIRDLNEQARAVDLLTVVDELKKRGQLKIIGGPAAISKLTIGVASAAHIEHHSFILREKEIKRQQISLGNRLVERGYNDADDPLHTSEWAADEVFKITNLTKLHHEDSNEAVVKQIIEELEATALQGGMVGINTGFEEQDNVLGGYQAPNLIITAARPGMGKTAKMLCEAYHIAVVQDIPVLIFSMEMSKKELLKRLAVIHAKVGAWIYRQKGLNTEYTDRFKKSITELATKKIIIDDTPAISSEQMRNRAKREMVKNGIKIIFADYLQLMSGPGEDVSRISHCSRQSKQLAKELNIPVNMLAQVGRAVNGREPQLSDLKGSGSIEEDADVVVFVHRPPYYDDTIKDKKQAFFIVAKHRNGSLARIESRFIHDRAQFVDPGKDVHTFDDDKEQVAKAQSKTENLPF